MDWFKKHTDAVMIIGAISASMIWMNCKFNEIEKDIAVMKAVLVLKNILPVELDIAETLDHS